MKYRFLFVLFLFGCIGERTVTLNNNTVDSNGTAGSQNNTTDIFSSGGSVDSIVTGGSLVSAGSVGYLNTGGTSTGGLTTGGALTGGMVTGGAETGGSFGGSSGINFGGSAGGDVGCELGSSPECPANSCNEINIPDPTSDATSGGLFWISVGDFSYNLYCRNFRGEKWTLIYSSDGRDDMCLSESELVDFNDHAYLTGNIVKDLAEKSTKIFFVERPGDGSERSLMSVENHMPIINLRNLDSLYSFGGLASNNWYHNASDGCGWSNLGRCLEDGGSYTVPDEVPSFKYPILLNTIFNVNSCFANWDHPSIVTNTWYTQYAKMKVYLDAK